MLRIRALCARILTQFGRDRRTLALLFVAPVLVLWLLTVILNGTAASVHVATVDLPEALQTQLSKTDAHIERADASQAKDLIDALISKGAKNVVLKGIQREGENQIRNFVGGVECDAFEVHNEFIPYMLHGTGDLYCSCLLAGIMAGKSLFEAAWFAGNLTRDAIEVSTKQPHFQERGVSFELLLGKVAALLKA